MRENEIEEFERFLAQTIPGVSQKLDSEILNLARSAKKTAASSWAGRLLPLIATAAALYLVAAMWPAARSKDQTWKPADYSIELKTLDLARWRYYGLSDGKAVLEKASKSDESTYVVLDCREPLHGHRVLSISDVAIVFEDPAGRRLALYHDVGFPAKAH